MTRVLRRLLPALCGLSLAALSDAPAEVGIPGFTADPESGIEVRVSGFYDQLPKSGYAPMRVTIRNTTNKDRQWQFASHSSAHMPNQTSVTSDWQLPVEAGAERSFELIVPLATAAPDDYGNLSLSMHGPGVVQSYASYPSRYGYSGNAPIPFTLMSESIGNAVWSQLQEVLSDRNHELVGSLFDPSGTWLPSDWRGLLGAASVYLADTDWALLPAPTRAAIMEWTALGGKLVLLVTSGDPAPARVAGMPVAPGAYGLGRIETMPWDLGSPSADALAGALTVSDAVNPSVTLLEGYSDDWMLAGRVAPPQIRVGATILAVVVIASILGPINLVVLAGPRRRQRLFWTTPVIAFAAALGLGVMIVVQDGFGGEGHRAALALVLPGQRQVLTVQEQIAKTGVLLTEQFPLEEGAALQRIELDDAGLEFMTRAALNPRAAAGDWFRSRSVQAQCGIAVRPSRGRIEVVPAEAGAPGDAPPVLMSTIEDSLRDVFYVDPDGKVWYAAELQVGTRTATKASTPAALRRDWWSRYISSGGPTARGRIEELRNRTGWFFAAAEAPSPERFIATHPAIRWSDQLVYAGPCLPAGEGGP